MIPVRQILEAVVLLPQAAAAVVAGVVEAVVAVALEEAGKEICYNLISSLRSANKTSPVRDFISNF